jgi:hypothetical protein
MIKEMKHTELGESKKDTVTRGSIRKKGDTIAGGYITKKKDKNI